MLELRDWQQADVDKITRSINMNAGALVTSAPGAGKTVVSVEVAKRLQPETLLIIAPPVTHESAWSRTLESQGYPHQARQLIGTAKGKQAFRDLQNNVPGVYITSVQWFARQKWANIHPDMVIFDEIHQAARYGNVAMKRLVGFGNSKGLSAKYRIALSGTPFRNSFENLWTVVKWVEPSKVNDNFWVWRQLECETRYSPFAPQNREVIGERVPGRLVNSLTCYISHLQRESCCKYHPHGFLSTLPEPARVDRIVPMTTEQGAFYRGIEKQYVAWLSEPDGNGKVPVYAELPITARTMLRSCALALPAINEAGDLYYRPDAPSPKLDAFIDDLAALDGKRVLAVTHRTSFIPIAVERIRSAGYSVVEWSGSTTPKQRAEILKRFQAGEIDVILANPEAIGTGADGLQRASSTLAILSLSDDATTSTQMIGRLDRLGQTEQVTIISYMADKSLEVGHLDSQLRKLLNLNRSLERKS